MDGSDLDPERGPEDERTIAGERVRTFIDKVFGGRAVAVLRIEGDRVLHYPLGRVSNPRRERANALRPFVERRFEDSRQLAELVARVGLRRAPLGAVPDAWHANHAEA